jgi:hypothetical protein
MNRVETGLAPSHLVEMYVDGRSDAASRVSTGILLPSEHS